MKNMNNKEKKYLPIVCLLSFFIPVVIAFFAFYNIQIYPGSSNTLLIYDMKGELLPTYGYLSNPGPGYNSMFFSMSGALGYCFLGRVAHVLSFFDIVYKFVPVTFIPDAIYYVTIIKIGLCGLSMSVFLISRHSNDIEYACIIFLSSCYALMSYIFIYALWPLWMDIVMLFPLLALSIEKLISGKRNPVVILLLFLGIISDYQISYMAIIALTLYFFFRIVEEKLNFSEIINRTMIYAIHGIISAGLSSFMIFPVVSDLMTGKLKTSADDTVPVMIKNTPLDILKSFMPGSYSSLHSNASPNIFCGTIVVLLTLIWFVYGRKEIRVRIAGALVLLFYFISFIFGPLDRLWHGFRDPAGFSVRYSFTFVFFMICFAVRGYKASHEFRLRFSKSMHFIITTFLIVFTIIELFVNGSYILAKLSVDIGYTNKNEYFRYNEFMTELIGDADLDSQGEYYRLYKDFNFTYYDGALYGYDGLLILESSLNPVVVSFLSDIGIGASTRVIDECGITPPTASLFDFKYFISSIAQSDFYVKIGEFNHHYLYKNIYALPLIFETSFDPQDKIREFSADPFENVNIIYSDFLGESTNVFVKQSYVFLEPVSENYHSEYTAGAMDYYFTPDEKGVFWMFSDFIKTKDSLWGGVDEYGFTLVPIYADLCVNDEKIGSFRNANYSYCNELGILDPSKEVKLSLDTSYSELGNTYIYRYDETALGNASAAINENGFAITYIGNKGITAEGNVSKDGYVFISLPYNSGYYVYVDGKKTDYTSYRDTFLLVRMNAGKHELRIKFVPYGFFAGVITSLIFLVIMIIYIGFDRNKNYFEKKTVKHP